MNNCKVTGKLIYINKHDASLVITKNKSNRKKKSMRIYKCNFCNYFHLTSNSNWSKHG